MPDVQIRLRETAAPNRDGSWDLHTIFNAEVYPAIKKLRAALSVVVSSTFEPVRLTGALNAMTIEHEHKNLLVSHTGPTVLTLSEEVSVAMPLGTILIVGQEGVGQLTVQPQGAVVIRSAQSLSLAGQYAEAFMVKTDGLEWYIFGDIADLPAKVALFMQDRFVGGNLSVTGTNTDANVGELQWNAARTTADGTVARVASSSGHMGIVRVSGHPTTGSHQAIYLGHAAASGSIVELDEVDYMVFIARNIGTGRFRFGLGDDAAAAGLGSNSIVVMANADQVGFWETFTRASGVSTQTLTTVPIDTSTWIEWKIVLVSSSEIRFYADNVLVNTHTSTIPAFSTLMAPAIQAVTFTPGPFQGIGEVDTFTMQMKLP